jgi:predicted RNase H-like nuclease
MKLENPQSSTIIFGFDSAWTDSQKAPGAICAIAFDAQGQVEFHKPRLASFAEAFKFIEKLRRDFTISIVALDQPTVVPNTTGSRPVDKVAASLVSFVGGGVQPANRSKVRMFCDDAPIWPFLSKLKATENPLEARIARSGHFFIEVFPALALPALEPDFAQRLGAPKYNPQNRRKFRLEDWQSVSRVVKDTAKQLGVAGLVEWSDGMRSLAHPRKADQDRLDASICALIGLLWRAGPPAASVMLGDLESGYMITPLSDTIRPRLERAAQRRGVAFSARL